MGDYFVARNKMSELAKKYGIGEREIKFRDWNPKLRKFMYFTLAGLRDMRGFCWLGMTTEYTGLKDKNGKEIYEGDFIEYETNYYGKHKVSKDVVRWSDDLEHDGFGQPLALGYLFRGSNIKVIGNIFENQELL